MLGGSAAKSRYDPPALNYVTREERPGVTWPEKSITAKPKFGLSEMFKAKHQPKWGRRKPKKTKSNKLYL